jgi:hypothetical protein
MMTSRNLGIDNKSFIAAIRGNNLPAVRIHAESGCFSEYALQQSMTLAAFCGHRGLLKYFFNQKQNGDFDFLDTGISLEAASAAGRVLGVIDLLSFGADLHYEEDFPYYLALTHNHPVTAYYMYYAGIDLCANEHALRTAFKRGWRDLVHDIFSVNALANTPERGLEWSIRKGRVPLALGTMLAGADPAKNDSELIFLAIESGQDEIVRIMCERGADVLARGERVLLDTAKKSRRSSTLQTVYGLARKSRAQPALLPCGAGRTQGLKTIEGMAEFPRAPRIIPVLRPRGRGWVLYDNM